MTTKTNAIRSLPPRSGLIEMAKNAAAEHGLRVDWRSGEKTEFSPDVLAFLIGWVNRMFFTREEWRSVDVSRPMKEREFFDLVYRIP